jgi:nitrate reductase NapD
VLTAALRGGLEVHLSVCRHTAPKGGIVRAVLDRMPGVEIHAEAASKIIITLETDSEGEIVTRLNEISLLEGVMSATLVFHHFEALAETDPAIKE